MKTIRKLTEHDIEQFVQLHTHAYCGLGTSEDIIKERKDIFTTLVKEFPNDDLFGLYRDETLLGGMRLVDYTMNVLSTPVDVGGIGAVGVDLLYKKEKAAKELLSYACQHFYDKGFAMLALYPFRPDFYKKMGFGYGVEIRQYRIRPSEFPYSGSKEHLVFLSKEDRDEIAACYQRVWEKTHGMMQKIEADYRRMFKEERRTVGYKQDGKLSGYLNFSFDSQYTFKNDLVIHECFFETREAFSEFCTFLHSQLDQFDRIVINTPDENLHFLVDNPANGNYNAFRSQLNEMYVSGIGVMYRVLDVKKIFRILQNRNFHYQTCTLKLTVQDNFFPSNDGSTIIRFENGRASLPEESEWDVEIFMNIGEFSSLLMGAVDFKTLRRYGRAEISDPEYVNQVNALFTTDSKPVCYTYF